MNYIGIIGARKFKRKKCVQNLINNIPADSVIVTGACRGVCAWTIEQAKKKNIDVLVYKPDLENVQSYYEMVERYYQRNRELIERCNFVYAFVSEENGLKGGTKFEVDYAVKIGKPVKIIHEGKSSEIIYQHDLFPINEDAHFNSAWKHFFVETICR